MASLTSTVRLMSKSSIFSDITKIQRNMYQRKQAHSSNVSVSEKSNFLIFRWAAGFQSTKTDSSAVLM